MVRTLVSVRGVVALGVRLMHSRHCLGDVNCRQTVVYSVRHLKTSGVSASNVPTDGAVGRWIFFETSSQTPNSFDGDRNSTVQTEVFQMFTEQATSAVNARSATKDLPVRTM